MLIKYSERKSLRNKCEFIMSVFAVSVHCSVPDARYMPFKLLKFTKNCLAFDL